MSVEARVQALHKLDRLLSHDEEALFRALRSDFDKPEFETFLTEIVFVKKEIHFALKHLKKWMRPKKVGTPVLQMPGKNLVFPCPKGVVLIIGPWNYPMQLVFAPLVAALAAGNCATLKPSEMTPALAEWMKQAVARVFDPGLVHVECGGKEVTQELMTFGFDHVFFTGSAGVGRVIMNAAAKTLTPVTLELGGKSPVIIRQDADLEDAAKKIIWGKSINGGQTCVAPDYVWVHSSQKDQLLKLLEAEGKRQIDDPLNSAEFASMINEVHFERMKTYLGDGHLAFGGRTNPKNRKVEISVLEKASLSSSVMQNEIFGPVLPICIYEKETEVVDAIAKNEALQNPLSLYVFSRNRHEATELLRKIPCGGGCVNDLLMHLANPRLPFGGVRASGIGAYHGKFGFDVFTHYKGVFVRSSIWDPPFRYRPYTKGFAWVRKLFG